MEYKNTENLKNNEFLNNFEEKTNFIEADSDSDSYWLKQLPNSATLRKQVQSMYKILENNEELLMNPEKAIKFSESIEPLMIPFLYTQLSPALKNNPSIVKSFQETMRNKCFDETLQNNSTNIFENKTYNMYGFYGFLEQIPKEIMLDLYKENKEIYLLSAFREKMDSDLVSKLLKQNPEMYKEILILASPDQAKTYKLLSKDLQKEIHICKELQQLSLKIYGNDEKLMLLFDKEIIKNMFIKNTPEENIEMLLKIKPRIENGEIDIETIIDFVDSNNKYIDIYNKNKLQNPFEVNFPKEKTYISYVLDNVPEQIKEQLMSTKEVQEMLKIEEKEISEKNKLFEGKIEIIKDEQKDNEGLFAVLE